jgi:hypothetical protein
VFAQLGYAFWPEASAGEEARRLGADSVAAATSPVDVALVRLVDFPLRTEATGHLQPWHLAERSEPVEFVVYMPDSSYLGRLAMPDAYYLEKIRGDVA